MLMRECFPVRNGEIEVHLHRHIRQGPGGPLQVINLLEGKFAVAFRIGENQPIDIVACALSRLVSWPVLKSEKRAVELRQSSRISSVQDRLEYLRETCHGPSLRVHEEGFDHGDADEEWVGRLPRLSLGWVAARDDQCLVCFVNVALHRRHAIVASVQLRESYVG